MLLFCALVGFTFCIHCSADFFLSLRQLYVYCGRSSSLSEIIKIWNSPNSPKLPNNTIICLKDMNFWMHWHLWFKLSVLKYHFCLSTGNYVPEKKSFNNLYLKGTSKSCVLHNLHVFSTVVEKIKEWHGYNISWIFIMLGFFLEILKIFIIVIFKNTIFITYSPLLSTFTILENTF